MPEYFYKSECRPESELRSIWKDSGSGVTFQQWLDLRDRCRKDLFFLTVKILGWTRVIERVHKPVCEFFGKLNFDGVYHPGYTLEEVQNAIARQDPFKEWMLLDPRGAFKSTINSCNCVRILLNCPDARIFIVTGEYDNAVLFLQQIKKYFYQPEGAPRSKLQQLFPEYILSKRDGESESPLQCPARIHTEQKEPSLWVNAVTATLASQHCDWKIGDDVVSDRNSTTPEARKKLKDKYDNVDNLLDEWGYAINIGTRYALDDYYGERLKIMDEAPLKYFCRAAWKVREEHGNLSLRELKPEMVDLLFPEKLDWQVLRKKLLKNERDFRCQQLNEPQPDVDAVNFTEDVLRAHLEQPTAAPIDGDLVITWDSALTSSEKADYSCGAVGRIDKAKAELHVLEIVFGRWKQSELAYQIVELARKWSPRIIVVESAGGTDLMKAEIARVARRLMVATPIIFRPPSNKADAKANRIKGLETLLAEDRLYFVQGPWIDETFLQFCRYTGLRKNKGRKDDVPDAVSMLQSFLPAEARAQVQPLTWEQQEELRKEQELKAHQDAFHDYIQGMHTPVPEPLRKPQITLGRKSRFDFRNFGPTQ